MRKNLLTLTLGFSFLFFGMFLTNVEASNGSIPKVRDIQNQISKSVNKRKLINEFNKNISKLKEVCSLGAHCDYMIAESALVFDQMIAACDYNEGSQSCQDAQRMVDLVAAVTLHYCSLNAKLIKRDDFIQKFSFKLAYITAKNGKV